MQAVVLIEAQSIVQAGQRRYVHIPVVMPEAYLRVGCCGTCGDSTAEPRVTLCTRTDCGLANARHTQKDRA